MRIRHLGCMAALAALSLQSAAAAAACQLQRIGVLPVDMQGLRPLISTKINGLEARFMLDSGAFYSTIWRDAAAQYQLPITALHGQPFYISGTGGRASALIATAQSFEFLGVAIPKVQFIVIDQTFADDYVGILGENLLQISDVEYDLASGTVRFFKPVGCEHQPLAYWAVSTPYSAVDLQSMYVAQNHLSATATVNGHRMTVWFDTGSPRSFMSLEAAQKAGITLDSQGVTFLGLIGGIGPASTRVWSAPVDTFQLGGEKVQHTHLLIANLGTERRADDFNEERPDMLLGADFFLSHRIYVARSQKKLYFTYNGGPLFNLNVPGAASQPPKPPASPDAGSQTSATTAAGPGADTPTDADGFRRRGLAYASMREFGRSLADLTRACELAPGDADNHYDRGRIYEEEGQLKPALMDFDAAIKLRPDDIDARLARAELLQGHPEIDPTGALPEVKSDLDAVSRLAAPAASVRLTLGELYGKAGDYSAAVDQLDQWLSQHPLQNDQVVGLNARCWLRATANQELRAALEDCNHALDLRQYAPEETGSRIRAPLATEDPDVLDSRGLVNLRLGNLKDAIRDYDTALQINPNMPTSLYGRGLAELRMGGKAQGQNDLAAAQKLSNGIAQRFARMGLAP